MLTSFPEPISKGDRTYIRVSRFKKKSSISLYKGDKNQKVKESVSLKKIPLKSHCTRNVNIYIKAGTYVFIILSC